MDQPRSIKRKKPRKNPVLTFVFRFFLSIVTLAVLLVTALSIIMNVVFNGPYPNARNILAMSLLEPSGTKWIPALFIGQDGVDEILNNNAAGDLSGNISSGVSGGSVVVIPSQGNSADPGSEWKDYPDGIRIENVSGDTYSAYVMVIRDPSKVYMATSSDHFDPSIPGTRIHNQIETEGAIAAINAGAFFDNGTSSAVVGSYPEGLVVAGGEVRWNSGKAPEEGFVGFNKDNILVVAQSMTADQAMELNIRDGCCFGPVLIMDGQVNISVYNSDSGFNPRTAIGQRADGAVLFVCIDGRQAGSLGGTYKDMIDIMVEYGAVNACNLDGGSSTVMLYRDQYGRYNDQPDRPRFGANNDVVMVNNYSLLQQEPRRMPTFFMVRPASEE